jgi:hypothetical protein
MANNSADDYRERRIEALRKRRKSRQFIDILAAGQEDAEDRREERQPDQATRIPIRLTDDGAQVGPADPSIRSIEDREVYLRCSSEPSSGPRAGGDEAPAFEAGAEGYVLPRQHPLDRSGVRKPSPAGFGTARFG